MNIDYNRINHVCTKIEKGFNICNSLPIVAKLTSPLRIVAGKIQLIAAAAIGLGVTIAIGVEKYIKSNPNQERVRELKQLQNYSLHHMSHGFLNMFRGIGETIMAVPSMGLLNALTFLPLNLVQDEEFAPINQYKLPAKPAAFVAA